MDKDYFGKDAKNYKLNRPGYSPLIVDKIKEKLEHLGSSYQTMLDVATGSGQLAIALASKFKHIYGLDISEKQINEASQLDNKPLNVKFQVFDCSQIAKFSEESKIPSYDLITCGQCLHWFEKHKILSQIKALLKKETGLLAVVSYVKLSYEPCSQIGQQLVDVLEKYRLMIWPYFVFKSEELDGYPSYPFSEYFSTVEKQTIEVPFDFSIDHSIKYMCTWSGVQNYNEKEGKNFNEELRAELASLLKEEDMAKLFEPSYFCKVSMKYSLIFAYK